MKHDESGNIVVTLDEYHADASRLLRWANDNKVRLIALDEEGKQRIVTGYFPPSPEEEREQLRDAVIESANQLIEAYAAIWTGSETATVGQVRDNLHFAIGSVMKAARELSDHERKAGGT